MIFEWDPLKNKTNFKKHNVLFEDAVLVFKDKNALSIFDEVHSIKEERWVTLGMIPDIKILLVVHSYKKQELKEVIRIISARKATKKESQQYYSRL